MNNLILLIILGLSAFGLYEILFNIFWYFYKLGKDIKELKNDTFGIDTRIDGVMYNIKYLNKRVFQLERKGKKSGK